MSTVLTVSTANIALCAVCRAIRRPAANDMSEAYVIRQSATACWTAACDSRLATYPAQHPRFSLLNLMHHACLSTRLQLLG